MINSDFFSTEVLQQYDEDCARARESYDMHVIAYPFSYYSQIDSTILEKSEVGNKLLRVVKKYFQSGIAPKEFHSFEETKASLVESMKNGMCLSLCRYVAAAAKQNPEGPFSSIVQAAVNDRFSIMVLQGAYHLRQDLKTSIKMYDFLTTQDGLYQKYIFSQKHSSRSLNKIVDKLRMNHDDAAVDAFKKMHKFCKKNDITDFSNAKFQAKKKKENEKAFSKELSFLGPPRLRTITTPAKRKTAEKLLASLKKIRQDFLGISRIPLTKSYYVFLDEQKKVKKFHRKVNRLLQGNTPGELRISLGLKKVGHAISVIQTKQGMYFLDQNTGAFEAKDREKFITFLKEKILSGKYNLEARDLAVNSIDAYWRTFA